MKRMLINASHEEELRVALVDGQRLYDLDIEHRNREQKKANIYKGRITRIEPSLEAAFVDFGAERHGFLPLKEISREYFSKNPKDVQGRFTIKDVVAEGTEIIVQVAKEERGNKGAALSTFISLAGRYLVLMPNNPRAGGISRRIEGDERAELRDAMSSLTTPKDMGVIVRTAGVGRNPEELQWDLDYLLQLWSSITDASVTRPAPFLIYQESNVIIRTIRDYLRQDIGEVCIDSKAVYEEALGFVRQVMPQYESKIKLYDDPIPLFNRYQIESQIETAFEREVKLPSGGSIVIDPTEALVSIDINSSKATKGSDIEDTALTTNLEAADEIARQLRLRDIGGLIVVDFIDMLANRNQREVENRMRDALEIDRARIQVGRISRFGLMELSRQRLRPSLGETSGHICPRCNGTGFIRDLHSLALSIMRLIEEESMKENTAEIHAQVPISIATYLLNEKRETVFNLERKNNVRVLILPNPNLETPHFEVNRFRTDQITDQASASYEIIEDEEIAEEVVAKPSEPVVRRQEAAVQMIQPATPAPMPTEKKEPGFFARFLAWFAQLFGGGEEVQKESENANRRPDNRGNQRNRDRNSNQTRNRTRNNPKRRGGQSQRGDSPQDNRTSKPTDTAEDGNRQEDSRPEGNRQEGNRQQRAPRQDNRNKSDAKSKSTSQQTATGDSQEQGKEGEQTQRRGKRRNPNDSRRRRQDQAEGDKGSGNERRPRNPKRNQNTEQTDAAPNAAANTQQAPADNSQTATPAAASSENAPKREGRPQRNRPARGERAGNDTRSTPPPAPTSTSTDEQQPESRIPPSRPVKQQSAPASSGGPSADKAEAKPEPKAEVRQEANPATPQASKKQDSAPENTSKSAAPETKPAAESKPAVAQEEKPASRASNDPREVKRRQQAELAAKRAAAKAAAAEAAKPPAEAAKPVTVEAKPAAADSKPVGKEPSPAPQAVTAPASASAATTKPAEPKPAEPKATVESKPAPSKPATSEPTVAKTAEPKPAATEPAAPKTDAKPAEAKPVESKPQPAAPATSSEPKPSE